MSCSVPLSATVDLAKPNVVMDKIGELYALANVDGEQSKDKLVGAGLVGEVLLVTFVGYPPEGVDGVFDSRRVLVGNEVVVVVSSVVPFLPRHVEHVDEQDS